MEDLGGGNSQRFGMWAQQSLAQPSPTLAAEHSNFLSPLIFHTLNSLILLSALLRAKGEAREELGDQGLRSGAHPRSSSWDNAEI